MNKTTFKLNDNLFFIDGYYYAVDKDAEIEHKDCVFNIETNDWFRRNIRASLEHDNKYFKIIFSTNPSLELPLLVFPDKKNEIEKLAEEHTNHIMFQEPDLRMQAYNSFIDGYKANPAKFTEQDMIEFAEWYKEYFHTEQMNDRVIVKTIKELLNLYLQSKEKIIESFEVEMEEIFDNSSAYMEVGHADFKYKPKLNSLGQIEAINIK